MSGWHHASANWKPKTCPVCAREFTPRSGAHRFCSTPCRGKWKYITGSGGTEQQYKTISGDWRRYLRRLLLVNGKRREFLSVEALMCVYERQHGLCALTGVALTCELVRGVRVPTNASVDRIVAGGPYVEDNVQLVCSVINKWRGDTSVNEFIGWCRRVAAHADGARQ